MPSTGQDIPLKYRLQAGNTNYDGETLIQLSNGDRTAVSIICNFPSSHLKEQLCSG